MEGLKADGYRNVLREEEPGLLGIGIEPSFSIGQRCLLVQLYFPCPSVSHQHPFRAYLVA